jgi:hypothetical protein
MTSQMRSPASSLAAPPAVIIDPPVITIQAQVITAINARLKVMDQGIKEEISDLKTCIAGHSASLATLERTQQELRNMLLMLCGHQAITVASAAPSTSTSVALSPVVGLFGPRVGEGSVPARVQSNNSTTPKARGKGQRHRLSFGQGGISVHDIPTPLQSQPPPVVHHGRYGKRQAGL